MATSSLPRYLLLDGGLSTALVDEFGQKEISHDPLWGSRLIHTNPELVKKVHLKFLEAGCDIIETITYQASPEGFKRHLCLSNDEEAVQMMKRGVQLACEARDEFYKQLEGNDGGQKPLVAASMGPYGAFLCDGSEYTGNYVDTVSEQELLSWHQKQLDALVGSGEDLLAFDTIPALKEATTMAGLLAGSRFQHVKAWMSFSCKDGLHLNHGERFADAAEALLSCSQIVAIGINCTAPEHIASLVQSLSERVKREKLIVVYPNSGETWSAEKSWHATSERPSLASYVREWMDARVNWIGGCCRVSPHQLKEAKAVMRKYIQEKELC